MGLTSQSTGKGIADDIFYIKKKPNQYVIALAGNPNTGKSTVFNYLTGLNQHTGNWPGKTVVNAQGEYTFNSNNYILVDLPGSYSLFTSSKDEEVAKEFICHGNHDAVVVVADATCIERNLNLVFQIMELTNNVILCVNLIDEANKKNIQIDRNALEKELGIPVVFTAARKGVGMNKLQKRIEEVAVNKKVITPNIVHYSKDIEQKIDSILPSINHYNVDNPRYFALRTLDSDINYFNDNNYYMSAIENYENLIDEIKPIATAQNKTVLREQISKENYENAKRIKEKCVKEDKEKINRDKKIDDILTSKIYGLPIMLLLLGLILWITIQGANYPSQVLAKLLFGFEDILNNLCIRYSVPPFIQGMFVTGMYKTLAWVVSVMLPPMAIFFPLFTLLEDLGYLPRVAFNLDHMFKKACAHGKQCLCMGMVNIWLYVDYSIM